MILRRMIKDLDIRIAILTVPPDFAREITEDACEIWN